MIAEATCWTLALRHYPQGDWKWKRKSIKARKIRDLTLDQEERRALRRERKEGRKEQKDKRKEQQKKRKEVERKWKELEERTKEKEKMREGYIGERLGERERPGVDGWF